ncbi:MAG: M48 family metallopeptidase [Lachnospiraceae bacterium]|nr:M48 family metallopeptidase [Lachnospiraceae bacterium]
MQVKRPEGAPDAEPVIVVRAPLRMSNAAIGQFVESHRKWIEKQYARLSEPHDLLTEEEIEELTRQAKKAIPERAAYYAGIAGVTYGRITIRHQRTRWGSCSSKGNLSFNCLLMLAPPEVLDSVIVHELCHRKYMNHSPAFYAEVERVFPEYRRHHGWLKKNGDRLLSSLPR